MLNELFVTPPVAFLFIFALCTGFAHLLSKLSYKGAKDLPGKQKTYACGEDVSAPGGQHEYGEFFPFAFFFTMMHVVALMLAALPVASLSKHGIAVLYFAGAFTGLLILFRR